jgi:phosphoserine phosphatase
VYLVSGGFQVTIFPVAEMLKIDRQNVFANKILFDENGNFL